MFKNKISRTVAFLICKYSNLCNLFNHKNEILKFSKKKKLLFIIYDIKYSDHRFKALKKSSKNHKNNR